MVYAPSIIINNQQSQIQVEMEIWKVWKIQTVKSASAAITLPNADSDLLMFLASSNTMPSAPVLLT